MSRYPINFLVVVAEDVGIGDFTCYNKKGKIQTTNVDFLAENGVTFTNAHSTAALCAPARYSLLTGNYPKRQKQGVRGQWGFNVESSIKPEQKTIANILQNKGYRTGLFGKTGIGGLYNNTETGDINWTAPMIDGPTTWGFDYSFIIPRGHQWLPLIYLENNIPTCNTEHLIRGQKALEFAEQKDCTGGGVYHPEFVKHVGYADPDFDVSTVGENLLNKVEKFLDETDKNKPFFIHFCCDGAHSPYDPPESIRGNPILNKCNTRRNDMVYETDILLGELRKILRARRLEDNTVICFTSDHGAMEGDNGNMHLRMGKSTMYEGGLRVPLIVNYPNQFLRRRMRNDLVCAMDILPTFLELIDVKIEENEMLDAKSLIPSLTSDKYNPTRDHLLINHAHACINEATNEWTTEANAIYYLQFKLIFDKEKPISLYNLETDPSEKNNLLTNEEYKQQVNDMISLKARLVTCANTRNE